MRGGWLGGIAAGLIAAALATCAEGAVIVNGRPVSVDPPARMSEDSLLVPVVSLAPFLGMEATENDGRVALRWSGGCGELSPGSIRRVSGIAYARIDDLVSCVAGTIRRVGDDFVVDVAEARLIEFSAGDGELIVRLDRFAPTFVTTSDGDDVVRLYNCRAGVTAGSIPFGPEGVGLASLVETNESICELRVTFLEEAAVAVRRFEADGAYSLFLAPAEASSTVSTTLLGSGLSLFNGQATIGDAAVTVFYVWAEAWRGRLDVRPLLPPTGAGTQGDLAAAMASSGAAIALSARSGADPGLVVIDGVPYSAEEEPSLTLAFDVFGSLEAFLPEVRMFAVSSGVRIPVDGVGRPVGYDELVGYPAGYSGDITRGFPEGFSVVRVRNEVVVSILEASFVVADPSATLLVASGAARTRLGNLALGDRVDLVCEVDPDRRFIQHALSIDRILVWDGQAQLEAEGDKASFATSWTVAGTDWQGGFFFLCVTSDSGLTDREVASILAYLPTAPSRAVVLERDGAGALALDVGAFYVRWGSRDPVAVSLGAVLQ